MNEARNSQWRPLYFPSVAERLMPPEQCVSIIDAANRLGFETTTVQGGDDPGYNLNEDVRICEAVALVPHEQFRALYEQVAGWITGLNQKQYGFRLTGMESLQVMRYSVGSFFREHSDLGYQPDESAGRKISLIVQLTDGAAYEGGELVLFGEEHMPRTQGTVCMFPSWLPHRVDPLTAGTRHTLVAWGKGPPFS